MTGIARRAKSTCGSLPRHYEHMRRAIPGAHLKDCELASLPYIKTTILKNNERNSNHCWRHLHGFTYHFSCSFLAYIQLAGIIEFDNTDKQGNNTGLEYKHYIYFLHLCLYIVRTYASAFKHTVRQYTIVADIMFMVFQGSTTSHFLQINTHSFSFTDCILFSGGPAVWHTCHHIKIRRKSTPPYLRMA